MLVVSIRIAVNSYSDIIIVVLFCLTNLFEKMASIRVTCTDCAEISAAGFQKNIRRLANRHGLAYSLKDKWSKIAVLEEQSPPQNKKNLTTIIEAKHWLKKQ